MLALILATGLLAACDDQTKGDERPLVVATTTILGDIAANVVGDDARLEVLMPRGADPHDFEPSSRQVALLAEADLVIANGLGLEEGLGDVIDGVRGDGVRVLEVAGMLDPLPFGGGRQDEDDDDGEHDLEGVNFDPHFWFDPLRVAEAGRLIASALGEIDASVDWSESADRYATELASADERIAAILAAVPAERRQLVTNHDSLGYFADRYGFEIAGMVIPGGSTLGEPGSQELAELVALIDSLGIPAIFADTTDPSPIATAIAAEVGHPVAVVTISTGSLGEPGGPAGTLIAMLEENARLITEALA
ncbi:MAG: metal ABC transporter substrate-binding protein [Acidimicrobiia bacterium]